MTLWNIPLPFDCIQILRSWFKLGMMLGTLNKKFEKFDSSLNGLDPHWGLQVVGEPELAQALCCKMAWKLVDYVRKMTAKKSCKCDKYGSFEHLLFLFFFSFGRDQNAYLRLSRRFYGRIFCSLHFAKHTSNRTHALREMKSVPCLCLLGFCIDHTSVLKWGV